MGIRLWHQRLSTNDIEDLTQCLAWLNSIHDSVNATGMAGKKAVCELCSSTYHVIERVLDKERRAFISWQQRTAEAEKTTGGQGDS